MTCIPACWQGGYRPADGGRRAVARQGHARLHGSHWAVHGVGGVHAGTGTAAGTGVFGQVFQLFFGHELPLDRSDAFKDADKSVLFRPASRAAAHDDGGQVQAHHGHEHTGTILSQLGMNTSASKDVP